MNKQWEVFNTDEEKIAEISSKFNISKVVSKIIVNRGLTNEDDIHTFLNPTRHDFHDPFLLPDMDKAVNRIIEAINNNEKTVIYGDYDVDGITSSTVLKRYLEERGLHTDIYTPNRLDEGYGLNVQAINKIASEGYKLIITVDCGITGKVEVDEAKKLGIDIVITDHHEPTEKLPSAIAVVDAKRKDSVYPFKGLAGVGVAFKTMQAISMKLGLSEETYLKYMDIVCIGTIADIVPLKDENRVISKLGLKLIKQTRNVGIKNLLTSTGYRKIDSSTVSFGMAPRINACGRMGHEKTAVELFLTNDTEEAKQITQELNKYNQQRQDIEKNIFEEAKKLIDEKQGPCIVIGKENWHHGVIGIVASKITELYGKPSILLCYEDDIAKGSGRSIKGFDLFEALEQCNENIEQFGGHNMAIGITIRKEKLNKFINEFEEYAKEKNIESIVPVIKIDEKIELKDIDIEDIRQLKLLEPFGEENPTPLFQLDNLKIISIRALSEGKHLKMVLKDDFNKCIDVIGFNMGHLVNEYKIGNKIDVVGILEINNYNNIETINLELKDMRHSI